MSIPSADLTPEELAIQAGIEARLTVLRDQQAAHEREAAGHQQAAQRHAMEAIRLAGGIAELESLASGFGRHEPAGMPEEDTP